MIVPSGLLGTKAGFIYPASVTIAPFRVGFEAVFLYRGQ